MDDRLTMDDFVRAITQLRVWGSDVQDVKQVRQLFHKYDENKGGKILFDAFILLCEEQKLSIENDTDIIKAKSRPKKVYKIHQFLKAGEKRPNKIDNGLWKLDNSTRDLDIEIDQLIYVTKTQGKPKEKKTFISMNQSLDSVDESFIKPNFLNKYQNIYYTKYTIYTMGIAGR